MCSIRNGRRLAASLALAALAGVAGCSTQQEEVYAPVNNRPIVGDDAIALRNDWPRSVAYYQNGSVAAWSTRFPYEVLENQSDVGNLVLDTVMFVGQTVALPIEFVVNPPFQPQVWYGVELPPTYTAQPKLPPRGGNKPPSGALYVPRAAQ